MTDTGGSIDAGRLSMDAYVDTSGMTRGLQARVDAEMKTIRAKIKAEIDAKSMVAETRKAAAAASRSATVKFKTDVDTRGVVTKAAAAAKAASKAAVVKIRTEVDNSAAANAAKGLGGDSNEKVKVDADTTPALTKIEALKARVRAMDITIPVKADSAGASNSINSLGKNLMGLSKVPALVGGIYALGTAAIDAGSGLFAMASAAGNAIGVLGGLPSVAGAAAQGLAALVVGFSGIGGALKALGSQQANSARDTQALGQAHRTAAAQVDGARASVAAAVRGLKGANQGVRAAAQGIADANRQVAAAQRGVADAERALGDARHQAAEDARSSAETIANAEYTLSQAKKDDLKAERDLNQARLDAIQYIKDLRLELNDSVDAEKAAANGLLDARAKLADVQFDPSSTDKERRDAVLGVKEAEDQLADARNKHQKLAKDQQKVDKTGIAGTDIMIQAREAEATADHNLQQAEQGLSDAQHQAAETARSDAENIKRAQEGVADAHRNVAAAMRGATNAHQQMADALARRREAEAAVTASRKKLSQEEAAAARVGKTLSASQLAVAAALDKLSPAGQRFARYIFSLQPLWIRLRNAVQTALLPPIQRGVKAALPLLGTLTTGLVGTASRIGSLGERLGALFGSKAFRSDLASIMRTNNRALTPFSDAVFRLVNIMRNLAVVAGPTLLVPFAKFLDRLALTGEEATTAGRQTGKMADYFDSARRTAKRLWDILANLLGAIHGVGKAAAPSGRQLLATLDKAARRWNTWANSDAGQKRMRAFFKAVQPVAQAVGKLAGDIIRLFANLSESNASPLMAFVGTLDAMVNGLGALVRMKGIGTIISGLLTLAGAAGAFGFIAGGVLRLVGSLTAINRVLRVTTVLSWAWNAAVDAGRAAALGTRIQLALLAIQEKIQAGLTRAMAAAQFVFDAAMDANPLALMVVAIAAVVAGLIYAYQHFDKFRHIVDACFRFVVKAAQWLYDVLFGHSIFPDMLRGFQTIFGAIAVLIRLWWAGARRIFTALMAVVRRAGGVVSWLWTRAVRPAFNAIRAAIAFAWARIIRPTFQALMVGLRTLGHWFSWLWTNAVRPAWNFIRAAVQTAWRLYYKPILKLLWNALQTLGHWFSWLWRNAVQPAWNNITSAIRNGWRNIIKPAFDALKTGIGKVADAFDVARKAIGRAWGKIRAAVRTPIRAVLSLVNKWVIDKFNWISGKLGGPKIADINLQGLATGGPVKMLRGGQIPGYSPSATADNIPIMATADEFMVRQKSAKRLRREKPGVLEYINRFGKIPPVTEGGEGVWGYAKGGLIRAGHAINGAIQGLAGGGTVVDGKRLSIIAARQLRLAENMYRINLRVIQGGYGGSHVAASGTSHNYPGVADVGPGSKFVEKILRKVGFAAWARNIPGRRSVGSGAHVHAVSLLDPGDRSSPQVYGSWPAHKDGLGGGPGSDPAPHYPWVSNLRQRLGDIPTSVLGGGGGGGGGFHVPSFLSTLGHAIAGAVKSPAKWLLDKAKGAIAGFKDKYGHTAMGQMLAKMPSKLIDYAGDKIRSVFTGAKSRYDQAHPGSPADDGPVGTYSGRGGHLSPAAARAAGRHMIPKSWSFSALNNLWNRESGWRWNADNPGSSAYGIPQALPGHKMSSAGSDWHDNALTQIRWGLGYIRSRYGSSGAAWGHSQRTGWYDQGGPLYPGSTLSMNGTGKTETVFTNDNMVELGKSLQDTAAKLRTMVGTHDKPGTAVKAGALVDNLTLIARPEEMPSMLRDANHEFKKIRLGGVYARGTTP